MTTDTTGRQGERQRVSNMEMRQVRSVHTPDATSEWCSWCGDEWPCFVAAMIDDLDNTRAELRRLEGVWERIADNSIRVQLADDDGEVTHVRVHRGREYVVVVNEYENGSAVMRKWRNDDARSIALAILVATASTDQEPRR
jgi:hypothetical protein